MATISVITGAAGSMGACCARRISARGDAVLLADRRAESLEPLARELRASGATVHCASVDVTDSEAVSLLARTSAAQGELGSLVLAAGKSPAMGDWRDLVAVNFVGTWHCLEAFAPLVRPGSVAVGFSSMAAAFLLAQGHDIAARYRDDPGAPDLLDRLERDADGLFRNPEAAYRWSKLGVARLCQAAAPRWGEHGGRVVSVSPGLIEGPMNALEMRDRGELIRSLFEISPIPRLGDPDEVAAVVQFLTSEEASFVSGCDLPIDGGLGAQRVFEQQARAAKSA